MFKNNFKLELTTNVSSGIGSINKVYGFLREHNYKKILLIYDKKLFKNSIYVQSFIKKFKKKIKPKIIFFSGNAEPSYEELDKNIYNLKNKSQSFYDCIVSIGGGSAIDFAKGIATLLNNPGKSKQYKGFPTKLNPSTPLIAIPSTAGTGSEIAYNAVFIDLESKLKLGINTKNNYPVLAILDPKILANSPKSVILNSGLGALVRSIDTLFNKQSNNVSEIFSKHAFKLLFNTLPKFLNNRKNLEHCSKMQWGAYLSTAALLNSSSGPAGQVAYYLATNHNIPQGTGLGLAALNFFKKNHEKGFHKYSELYDLIDKKKVKKLSIKEKSKYVINELFKIFSKNKKFFKKINISKQEIEKIANLVYEQGHVFKKKSNNPVKLTKRDLVKIIRKTVE